MNISEIKKYLQSCPELNFKLPGGDYVPPHFHVTEVGLITKNFIDCGGTVRKEKLANFQLWNANDFTHRLKPEKLLKIIGLSEDLLGDEDLEIEVEYQTDTIGKYGLYFNGKDFVLTNKQTACLAEDSCGITVEKQKPAFSDIGQSSCCTPGSGCC